jgi:lipid A ethanolaminephosphotransferase
MIARLRHWLGASRLRFALLVSLWMIVTLNLRFWRDVLHEIWQPHWRQSWFVLTLGIVLVAIHAWLLRLVPGRRWPAWIAAALILAGSVAAYFLDRLGVFMDIEMLRNVAQTDPAEVGDLLTATLFGYVILLGVLPAIVVAGVELPAESLRSAFRQRLSTTAVAVMAIAFAALSSSTSYASFLREHKPLRYLINPSGVLVSSSRLALGNLVAERPRQLLDTGGPVSRVAGSSSKRPLLVFLVIGETARAADIGLGGYARQTTPELAARADVIYFSDVTACGTSTAYSLPCLLSPHGRERFDIDAAPYETNVLDVFAQAGFAVQWRDNNSGCKHLCGRIEYLPYAKPAGAARCATEHCFDEAMNRDLAATLGSELRSRLLVFHQVGSHGPAYYERYPPQFEVFRPACRTRELADCPREQIVNAYDNSIRYTDHVLAAQIRLLESLDDRYDSVLLYVSDHGESLGENGLYLHAAPYFMAPDTQKKVPLVLWTSRNYAARRQLDTACLRDNASRQASHDNVYHSLLGAAGLRNRAYRRERDLLQDCIDRPHLSKR